MPPPTCLNCQRTFTVPELLAGLGGYSAATVHFSALCPHCRGSLEFQVSSNRLRLGYTYWAGSLHFETTSEHSIAGLKHSAPGDPPGIVYNDVTYAVRTT